MPPLPPSPDAPQTTQPVPSVALPWQRPTTPAAAKPAPPAAPQKPPPPDAYAPRVAIPPLLGLDFPATPKAAPPPELEAMRRAAEEHGLFKGRSMVELLNTPAGRAWLNQAVLGYDRQHDRPPASAPAPTVKGGGVNQTPVTAPAPRAAPVVAPSPPPPPPAPVPTTFTLPGFGTAKNLLTRGLAELDKPPLTRYTRHLGPELKPLADKALGGLQSLAKNPKAFGPVLGMAAPIIKPLASNPLGLAALAAGRGLLAGGAAGLDAAKFLQPVLQRAGVRLG